MFKKQIEIYSPVDGEIKKLEEVDDIVFSSGMVGLGLAVTPESNEVYSIADGEVKVAFPTGHAYGVKIKKGFELLVHIGIETVTMEGKGFKANVKQGDKLTAGETLLAEIDLDLIKKEAKSTDIVIIATQETLNNHKVVQQASGKVKKGDLIFTIEK